MWRKFSQRWMAIANAIGNFNSRVILSLFYAMIVLPFGLAIRLFADPLRIRGRRSTTWSDIDSQDPTIESARRQF